MFIVIELQKTENGLAHLETVHNTAEEAESKYHQILMAAAVSSVPIHSAFIVAENGELIRTEKYVHTQQEQEEQEP